MGAPDQNPFHGCRRHVAPIRLPTYACQGHSAAGGGATSTASHSVVAVLLLVLLLQQEERPQGLLLRQAGQRLDALAQAVHQVHCERLKRGGGGRGARVACVRARECVCACVVGGAWCWQMSEARPSTCFIVRAWSRGRGEGRTCVACEVQARKRGRAGSGRWAAYMQVVCV